MSKEKWYKGVRVSRGSALYEALEDKDPKVAEKLFNQLEADFKKRYPQCTKEWFARMNDWRNSNNDNDGVVSSDEHVQRPTSDVHHGQHFYSDSDHASHLRYYLSFDKITIGPVI